MDSRGRPDGGRVGVGARLVGCAALVALACVAYARVAELGFVYDDLFYVAGNRRVLDGLSPAGVRWAFGSGELANWHPLTWLSLMLDAELFGPEPAGFHVTNLVLHVANALLLAAVLARATGEWWRSVAVAALFAVHPQHVESVAWVSERKDVLSTLFGLLALGAYVRYAERGRRHGAVWYALALLAFAASLMSKQMLVTLPFLLLVLDVWPLGRGGVPLGRRIGEKLPFLALAALASWAVLAVQEAGGATTMLEPVPLPARAANACIAYVQYLGRTFWPADLAVLYPHPGRDVSWGAAGASLALLLVLTAGAWAVRRGRPYVLVGWLGYLGTLVPAIGLVQVGLQQRADRYTYVPLIGVYVALVWLAASLLPRRAAAALGGACVFALVPVTRAQVEVWRDGATLFEHALAVTERNALAHNNLGAELLDRGRLDEAEEQLRAALAIDPDHANARYNLGNARLARGDAAGAEASFRAALAVDPEHARAHANLGLVLIERKELAEGIHALRTAVRLDPGNALTRTTLANGLAQVGSLPEAYSFYESALALDPSSARTHFNYANALAAGGRRPQALAHLRAAAALEPGNARIAEALARLEGGG